MGGAGGQGGSHIKTLQKTQDGEKKQKKVN